MRKVLLTINRLSVFCFLLIISCKEKTNEISKVKIKKSTSIVSYADLIGKKFFVLNEVNGELMYDSYGVSDMTEYIHFHEDKIEHFMPMDITYFLIKSKENLDKETIRLHTVNDENKDFKKLYHLSYDMNNNFLYSYDNNSNRNVYIDTAYLSKVKHKKYPKKTLDSDTGENVPIKSNLFREKKYTSKKPISDTYLYGWSPNCKTKSQGGLYFINDNLINIIPNRSSYLRIKATISRKGNLINMHLKRTENTDMHVPSYWKGYSTDSIIGKLGLLGNGKAEFLWRGLYNEKTKKRDYQDIQFIVETGSNPMLLENCGK
jgi:hypothetical protein